MADDEFIDCKCPYCEGDLAFPADSAGTAQACPACLESVVVPRTAGAPAAKLPIPITTPRLVVRRLHPDDWKDLLEIMANETLHRYTETPMLTEEEIIRWLEEDRGVRLTQGGQGLYLGLELSSEPKLMGYVSFGYTDATRQQAGFHLLVNERYHRRGYALETVAALLQFAFADIGLHRVAASCDRENLAARGLLEKAGMRCEGEFLQDRHARGAWSDTRHYAILEREWAERAPA